MNGAPYNDYLGRLHHFDSKKVLEDLHDAINNFNPAQILKYEHIVEHTKNARKYGEAYLRKDLTDEKIKKLIDEKVGQLELLLKKVNKF